MTSRSSIPRFGLSSSSESFSEACPLPEKEDIEVIQKGNKLYSTSL